MHTKTTEKIKAQLYDHLHPKHRSVSFRYPLLQKPIIFAKRSRRRFQDLVTPVAHTITDTELPAVVARHQSVLMRTLGDSDMRLQINKVQNLRVAIQKLNGLVIQPGETFSLWRTLGKPTERKGYTSGMLLAGGDVREGVGGGLCQLSNFLHWIFLHTEATITERHHHSLDVFPDSGRVLPFASGATIFYNYLDLRVKNTSKHPLQIKLWLTDKYLKGQIRSNEPQAKKFHIEEKHHTFVLHKHTFYRFNEIWRETYIEGKKKKTEFVVENLAPAIYKVTPQYLREHNYKLLKVSRLTNPELKKSKKQKIRIKTKAATAGAA